VVFAVNGLAGGGAERVVVTLANEHRDPDCDTLLLVGDGDGPYRTDVQPHVKVHVQDITPSLGNTMEFAAAIRHLFANYQVRAVISHLDVMNRMILRARELKAFDAPVIVVEQCDIGPAFDSRGFGRLEGALFYREIEWLYPRATAVVGVSRGVSRSIAERLNVPSEKVHTIYNPVALDTVRAQAAQQPDDAFADRFLSLPRPIVLGVGRLVRQKGFHDLLHAFRRLPPDRRGSLVILGDGELRESLRQLSEHLEVANQVHMPGFVQNPWWYMANSDLFTLSSHWEGFGLVVVEALAAGTPVVSTRCPSGPDEILTDSIDGRLVPVGDSPALADAMLETLRLSSTERRKRQEAGTVTADRFRPERILGQYLGLAGVSG